MQALWFERALLATGWATGVRLTIADGRIASIDTGAQRAAGDEGHALGLPGLPNVHSHAFQRAIAGLTERRGETSDSFWTWREQMYRFVDRMTPDDVEAVTAEAYVEMLESGFTRVGEFHYLHHDRDGGPFADIGEMAARVAAAADATGIGLTLLPVFYAHGNFGGADPSPGQRRFLNDPDRFARLHERSSAIVSQLPGGITGVAPHSLRAATTGEIAACLTLAGNGPVHIHIAEQTREVEDCIAWCGQRPVEHLYATQPVGDRWCLVHATHVEAGELAAIAASGAVVGLCPITEASLGDGIFPADDLLAAGGRLAVGSDSNVEISAPGELRMLEYVQRLARRRRNVLSAGEGASTGRTLFETALAGGNRALGVEQTGLRVGAPADIVSLAPRNWVTAAGTDDAWLDTLIFCAGQALIDCVWRHGRKLVEAGRHRNRDAIAARCRTTLDRISR